MNPMLDFPIDGGSCWVLYGLLIVWAALLVFGFILGKPDPERRRRLPLGARMGMSVALVIAAFVWWRAGTAGRLWPASACSSSWAWPAVSWAISLWLD